MFIGDFICKLHKYVGDTVIKVNHIGDWGNQFGYLLNYIKKYQITSLTNESLTEIYKLANISLTKTTKILLPSLVKLRMHYKIT